MRTESSWQPRSLIRTPWQSLWELRKTKKPSCKQPTLWHPRDQQGSSTSNFSISSLGGVGRGSRSGEAQASIGKVIPPFGSKRFWYKNTISNAVIRDAPFSEASAKNQLALCLSTATAWWYSGENLQVKDIPTGRLPWHRRRKQAQDGGAVGKITPPVPPKTVHVRIPGTCENVMYYGERELRSQMELNVLIG